MASIARRDDGRWRARYRDPAGREHAKHFTRRADAQRWLDDVVTAVNTGAWVDPARAQVTVAEWAKEWLEGQSHLKPSSWERYAGILREHVLPEWGERRIADITHAEIQRWVTALMLDSSPSTVHKIHRTLSLVLKLAVKDGRLVRNPADGVNLPRIVATEHVYLTHDQVDELAQRCGPHRLTVLFLAYTGVRFGEMAALRVRRLDLLRRRAAVAESVTLVRGERVWARPEATSDERIPRRWRRDRLTSWASRRAEGADVVASGVDRARRPRYRPQGLVSRPACSASRAMRRPKVEDSVVLTVVNTGRPSAPALWSRNTPRLATTAP